MAHGPSKSKLSPLWQKALESYHKDLAADDDFRTILETESLEDLFHTTCPKPFGQLGQNVLDAVNRLKPTFKLLNDFSVVLAVSFGAGTAVTALVWGSIRAILTLASAADSILQEVSNMLEELSLTLPRLKVYEKSVSLDSEMEPPLLAVYQEVICFYARAIRFFRGRRKHTFLPRNAWSEIREDFHGTLFRIKTLSTDIESQIELARMRHEKQKYNEVLDLMASLQSQRTEPVPTVTHYIPFTESARFWGRGDILELIDDALFTGPSGQSLRSFALYGMGGVGKTQIALKYANTSRERFDGVFWISAENLVTIAQSLRQVARTLGLVEQDTENDDNAVLLAVKNWLSSTKSRWLVVYDNVDDLDVIKHAWPAGSVGSILITSRDPAAAFSLAARGCQVMPFDTDTGSTALLNILGLDMHSASNQEEAKAITCALGGLPLALNQIGGFIVQRKVPLRNFLALYNRNSASVDARGAMSINYNHTLATVWEMALSKLSGNAKVLHMILSFLNPDYIQESLLTDGAAKVDHPDLQFMLDEIDFLDAQQVLLQGALIDKSGESEIMSIHRLLQRAVVRRMSIEEREKTLSLVVDILSANFPDTYTTDVGHQVASWSYCERSLPHMESIVKQSEHFKVFEHGNQGFAELLLRCSWYLYERENYSIALLYVDVALKKFVLKDSLAYASAVDLRGLINLDICRPVVALGAFEEAYKIRTAILPQNDPFLAANQVNLGLALTELRQLEKAQNYLQQSINIRLMHNSDRIGNSYSNMASLLLRMGKPNEAEAMLKSCPSLKDFSDETFLKTGNPRFSGDMILLSRIRLEQGLLDEALRFASKALTFRKECLGDRLKVCDSLHQVAVLLHQGDNTGLAIQLLEECIKISEGLPRIEGLGHLARANLRLSQIMGDIGKYKEGREYFGRALACREDVNKLDGDLGLAGGESSSFDMLVPWMLW